MPRADASRQTATCRSVSMRHQVETCEPYLDPSMGRYALNVDADALVREVGGLPRGKAALRDLYDLDPGQLPPAIRDRSKIPFGEGAGLDVSPQDSSWKARFNDEISDAANLEGRVEFCNSTSSPRKSFSTFPSWRIDGHFTYSSTARSCMDIVPS